MSSILLQGSLDELLPSEKKKKTSKPIKENPLDLVDQGCSNAKMNKIINFWVQTILMDKQGIKRFTEKSKQIMGQNSEKEEMQMGRP